LLLLEPSKEIVIGAMKFNVVEVAVAENIAANANIRLVLLLVSNGGYF